MTSAAMIIDFWTYATGFYGHDHIKQQCLQLEEEHGASTTLLLWLCWIDSKGIRLPNDALPQAQAIANTTGDDVRQQLVQARQQLRDTAQFTRVQTQSISKHLLAAELAIEKIAVQRLQDLTQKLPKLGRDEEALSLFDYLNELRVIYSGQISALLLEQARLFNEANAESATTE